MNTNPMKAIDLSQILKPYENQWVALSIDYKKVLGAGNSLVEVEKQAKKKAKRFIFHKVLPFSTYIPLGYEIFIHPLPDE